MYTLVVDGGGTPTVPTYFSYKCLESERRTKLGIINPVCMSRFYLFNLPPELLPPNCYVVDKDGFSTNNLAEYCACFYGLSKFKEYYGEVPLTIMQDSELVVRQILGQYACRQEHLIPWHYAIKSIWWDKITFQWVKREEIVKILGH